MKTTEQIRSQQGKSIYDYDITDLDSVIEGHHMRVTATHMTGIDTGRRRYRVECLTCGEVVHEATTGASCNMQFHVREAERRQKQETKMPEDTVSPTPPSKDPINPSHYKGDLVMRIIEKFSLGFRLGNVIKYILRHGEKAGLEDLKKARWYLDREISDLGGLLKKDDVE